MGTKKLKGFVRISNLKHFMEKHEGFNNALIVFKDEDTTFTTPVNVWVDLEEAERRTKIIEDVEEEREEYEEEEE